MTRNEAAELSRLLWDAREHLDMAGDIVAARHAPAAVPFREIRDRIDAYRQARGWNPHGFGGEVVASPPAGTPGG